MTRMKWIFLVTAITLVFATTAFPQPGRIGVYADITGATCDFADYPGVDALIYVIHTYTPGATGSQFKLIWAAGASMTYLGERVSDPYFAKGTAFSGISIDYGGCMTSPNPIVTLHFSGNGNSPACSFLMVIPLPGESFVYVNDCSDPPDRLISEGDCLVINDDGSCPCNLPGWDPCPDIVPVHPSTWGHIKMLFMQPN